MKQWLKNHNYLILVAVILGISAFFRFYNLASLFNFSLDEEVIAFHVQRITTGSHYPSLGVNAAGTGLYLGPFYFYAAAPFFYALKNQAIAGAIFASSLGVLTTASIILLGKRLFSPQVGLVAGFLHAASLTIALFERKFFNPTPALLISSISIICLHFLGFKMPKQRVSRTKAIIILGVALGFIFHVNLSLLFLIAFAVIYLRWKANMTLREWLLLSVSFLMMLAPLVFFELRHQGLQVQALVKLFSGSKFLEAKTSAYYWGFPFVFPAKLLAMDLTKSSIANELATCTSAIKFGFHWFGMLTLVISGVFLIRERKNYSVHPLVLAIFFGLFSLLAYPGRIQEYYAFGLAIPSLALIAFSLVKLKQSVGQLPFFGIIFGIAIINTHQLVTITHPTSLQTKSRAADYIQSISNQGSYSLEESGDGCLGYGLTYLLVQANHKPLASFEDPILGWLYREEESSDTKTNTIIETIVGHSGILVKTNEGESKSF